MIYYCCYQRLNISHNKAFRHGGGTIKRHSLYTLLVAITIVVGFLPFSQGAILGDTPESKTTLKIDESLSQVNAASKITKATAAEKKQLNNLTGKTGLKKLAKYINKHLNHRSGAANTAAGVEKTGYGDCWGLSDWTAKTLKKNGYTVRVVQGANRYSSRHRWVKVEIDGEWINFEPSLVTKRYGSKPYTSTCAKASKVIVTYNA